MIGSKDCKKFVTLGGGEGDGGANEEFSVGGGEGSFNNGKKAKWTLQ